MGKRPSLSLSFLARSLSSDPDLRLPLLLLLLLPIYNCPDRPTSSLLPSTVRLLSTKGGIGIFFVSSILMGQSVGRGRDPSGRITGKEGGRRSQDSDDERNDGQKVLTRFLEEQENSLQASQTLGKLSLSLPRTVLSYLDFVSGCLSLSVPISASFVSLFFLFSLRRLSGHCPSLPPPSESLSFHFHLLSLFPLLCRADRERMLRTWVF